MRAGLAARGGAASAATGARALVVVAGASGLLMSVGTMVLLAMSASTPGLPPLGLYGGAITVTGGAFAVVGLAIAMRRPRHPMAWITLALALSQSAGSFTSAYAAYGLLVAAQPPPLASFASWLSVWTWAPGLWLLVSLTYLFPDGRLASSAQRLFAASAVVGTLVMVVPQAVVAWPYRGPLLITSGGPEGDPAVALAGIFQTLGGLLNLAVAVAGITYLAIRFRRSTGVERQQLKWFVAAMIVVIAILWIGPDLAANIAPFDTLLGVIAGLALPIAIGIAILRYRLYEIDRIISRTLGWAVVTGVLVGVFVTLVVGLEALLSNVTQGQTLAVAASTLAAFALFQPLRRRVQAAVDRRFNRARYDAQALATAFGLSLREAADPGAATGHLVDVTVHAVQPRALAIWLRGASR